MNSEVGRKFASAAFIIGLFLLWEVLCIAFHVSDVILPRPSQVFVTLWQRAPALWPQIRTSWRQHSGSSSSRPCARQIASRLTMLPPPT